MKQSLYTPPLCPFVHPEMLDAAFWLAKAPEDAMYAMAPEAIAAFNEKTLAVMAARGVMHDVRLPALRRRAAQAGDDAFAAVAVRRLDLQAEPRKAEPGDESLQLTVLRIGEPVWSPYGGPNGWRYVLSEGYAGWVEGAGLGRCDMASAFLREPEAFLVVTGARLHLEQDPACPALSGMALDMGTVLRLQAPASGRAPYGCYTVMLPLRDESGHAYAGQALIPAAWDVHPGYLPYSRAALLHQAMKLPGLRYGWGGLYGAEDCSGLMRQLFRCFGFRLPRDASLQAELPCPGLRFAGLTAAEREKYLAMLPPGALLYFPGHIMLYLGEDDGRHYVLSAVGSFVPEGGAPICCNGVVVNELSMRRKNGQSWLESLALALVL